MSFLHSQIIQPFLLAPLKDIEAKLDACKGQLMLPYVKSNKGSLVLVKEINIVKKWIYATKGLILILGIVVVVLWFVISFFIAYGQKDLIVEYFHVILLMIVDFLVSFSILLIVFAVMIRKKNRYITEMFSSNDETSLTDSDIV